MTVSRRLWAAGLLLLLVQFGALYVQHGYAPAAVDSPPYNLTELPERLGAWQSEPGTKDLQTTKGTGADASVDRLYSKPGQPTVSLHFGRWCAPNSRAPHLPQACYAGAGWTKLDEETVQLPSPAESQVAVMLITWELDGQRVRSLHWYRRGGQTYSDWTGGTRAYRNLWGNSRWPAIEKVLMQTEFDDKVASRARLEEVAAEIDRWMQSPR